MGKSVDKLSIKYDVSDPGVDWGKLAEPDPSESNGIPSIVLVKRDGYIEGVRINGVEIGHLVTGLNLDLTTSRSVYTKVTIEFLARLDSIEEANDEIT